MGQVEFPMVSESEYSSLDDMNVLCVGKNDTNELEESPAYQQLGEGDQFDPVPLDTEKRKLILAENPKHQFLIDGGGACFGDSGGPLFKMVKDGYREKPTSPGFTVSWTSSKITCQRMSFVLADTRGLVMAG